MRFVLGITPRFASASKSMHNNITLKIRKSRENIWTTNFYGRSKPI